MPASSSCTRALRLAPLALALAAALPAAAHRLAPSYLELHERDAGRVAVLWRTPRLVAGGAAPRPALPAHCRPAGPRAPALLETALVERFELDCGGGGLVGARVGVDGLRESGTDAIVAVTLRDGRELQAIVTAASPRLVVPARPRRTAVAAQYLRLGAGHLLGGLDHLLLLLGLVCLLRGRRRLLVAVTAFTLGHSLTLALAVLGVVGLPQIVVELAIAATLVALGVELARPDPTQSFFARRPGLAPFGFGLVHGLGFAGALAGAGLPAHAIPLALLAFNLGIELAQLGVVGLALPAVAALRRAGPRLPRRAAELPATAVGSLGAFLLLERALAWLVQG